MAYQVKTRKFLAVLALLCYGLACQTAEESTSDRSSGGSGSKDAPRLEKRKREVELNLSGSQALFIQTFSNNSMMSMRVDRRAAEGYAARLEPEAKTLESLGALLAAQRLGASPLPEVVKTGRKIATLALQKDVDAKIPDVIELNMGLAAMQAGNFDLAEFYLFELLESRNGRIKAAANTALGVISLFDDRVPEAVDFWKESLKADGSFLPARLNLGFIALKYGDYETAGRTLPANIDDWYVQSGILVVARFANNGNQSERLCREILAKYPRHKPTLFNCGIFYLEEKKDFKRARQLVSDAVKLPGGGEAWEEDAYRILTVIEKKEQEALNNRVRERSRGNSNTPKQKTKSSNK